MYPEFILQQAKEKNLPLQDAAQTFLQVVVLRHLSVPQARFMGGTALVLGYGNPRFSEDVDLSQVTRPKLLEPGLLKARAELEGWFQAPTTLQAPRKTARTWRLVIRLGRSESLSLHIDSQSYRAYTTRPLVITSPPFSPFVCEAMDLDEIMAEKLVALAYRRYLGGRDLFDLWYHWLRLDAWRDRQEEIFSLLQKKLRERSLDRNDFKKRLLERVSGNAGLDRARLEWKRYLPPGFQKESVFQEIIFRCGFLKEILS